MAMPDLKVKLFADGADVVRMVEMYRRPWIKGFTTNPTLMRKAGIKDYEAFARDILQRVTAKPISFEVFSDDFPEMRRQALKIASWQKNVFGSACSTSVGVRNAPRASAPAGRSPRTSTVSARSQARTTVW